MSLIQKVASQAYKTFSEFKNSASFHQHLVNLLESAGKITSKDVGLDDRLISHAEKYRPSSDRAPVTYIHLWEDDIITVGIFVLKNGVSLPLHDHPSMHGIIKLLHGTVKVNSYSKEKELTEVPESVKSCLTTRQRMRNPNIVQVLKHPTSLVNTDSPPCFLCPDQNNLHEIISHDGPAAFLDILSPPYDQSRSSGDRVCHYYKDLNFKSHTEKGLKENIQYLMEIPQPAEFYCEPAPYRGPDINPYI